MRWSLLHLLTLACSPQALESAPPAPPPPLSSTALLEDQGTGDCFGAALAPAGDVNGDGYGDLIVGNSVIGECAGDAMVFLGSAEGLDPAGIPLSTGSYSASWFGAAVDGAGDLDGDGYDDLIVGSGGPGAYLFRGGPDGPEAEPWIALEKPSWHRFGRSVAGAGDVNDDGWPDVAVGGGDRNGTAVLYPGSAAGPREAWEVTASTDCELGLAGVGDVNDDGFDDLLTGNFEYDFLLLGDAALSIDRQYLAPEGQPHDYSHRPVHAGGGDVNGDGWPDLASARPGSGISIWLGSSEGFTRDWDLLLNQGEHRWLAGAVAMGGDMDGDGDDELAAAGFWESYEDGEVVLYAGDEAGPGGGSVIRWSVGNASPYGLSVAFTGDGDGDGFEELAIGYPGEQRVYLFPGGGDSDGDGYAFPGDCLDSDPAVHPGGSEICNGLDDDCDGVTDGADAEGATDWYADDDGDGYPAHDQRVDACDAPDGYLGGGPPWDCDGFDASIHPGAEEIPDDGIDQDCDGEDLRTDTGEAPPEDTDQREQEGGRCSHAPVSALGLSLFSTLGLTVRRRRRALLATLLMLAGCHGHDDDSDAQADTGWRDLSGVRLTSLLVGDAGETILAGRQGRVARWSERNGLEELPPAGRWLYDADIRKLLIVDGALWAIHEKSASRWLGEDWVDSGLDPGETSWGYDGELPGLVQAGGELWAFTELPPDNDPDCFVGCSTVHQLYLHRWDGVGWVRVHHLKVDGSSGHGASAGDELLLSHGHELWRWDEGALTPIDHPLEDKLVQTAGLGEDQLVTRSSAGQAAVGSFAGLALLSPPGGATFDFVTGTAPDDLYALAGGALHHHDGAAWNQIPLDTEAATDVAVDRDGSLHVLAYDGANSLHRGDRSGVVEVWREEGTDDPL